MIEAPTEDLSKFKYEDLLQFAKDSLANSMYQQARIDEMSKEVSRRDYFAGQALMGLITLKGADCQGKDVTAIQCTRMADALLKELAA